MESSVLNLFSNLTALTIDQLDKALVGNSLEKVGDRNSSQYFFNLSQVRFVNLQAVSRLTLVIASCMKKTNQPVLVALPTIGLTEKEKQSFNSKSVATQNGIRRSQESRKKANAFLKTLGFDTVLADIATTIPGASVLLTESFGYATSFTRDKLERAIHVAFNGQPLETTLRNTSNYKCIYPLKWIECRNESNSEFQWDEQIFDDVEKILGHKEKGLDPLDVEAIKNVVLPELIKNVHEHSCERHALLTIGLIASQSLFKKEADGKSTRTPKRPDSDNIESPYLQWLFDNQNQDARTNSQVEIYFGDIGTGILTDDLEEKYRRDNAESAGREKYLSSEKLMQWVYSRWAAQKTKFGADGKMLSEQRSGTKGLYRIRRIIRKYSGIFHITTSNQKGSVFDTIYRDFESKTREDGWGIIERGELCGFLGTLIQIKMCPFVQATHFRFMLDPRPSFIDWQFINYTLEHDERWENKFSETHIAKVIRHFQRNRHHQQERDDDLCIVFLLDLFSLKESNSRDPWVRVKEFIEKKFEYFSLYGHPASIVVVLSRSTLSNGELEDQLRSITDRLSENMRHSPEQLQRDRDNEHYYAPVMVIGEDRKVFWFGGHKGSVAFLNTVTSTNSQLAQSNAYEALDSDISITPEEKKRIAHVLHADGCPENLYHFHNIESSFEEGIKHHNAKGSGLFCSPSLEITKDWFDVESFFHKTESENNALKYAWLFSLKADEALRDRTIDDDFNYHSAYLLIDHGQQQVLAEEFARLTGIPHANIKNLEQDIDPNVPHRSKLFPKNANVILLTTIISSSETARRLVKFVRRDSANPVFLLCLYNKRNGDQAHQRMLETWGEQTHIISILEDAHQPQETRGAQSKVSIKEKEEVRQCWDALKSHFNDDGSLKRHGAIIVKSPKREKNEFPEKQPEDLSTLQDWIMKSHALHYSHVGIYKSRHFTFYLDKRKLLEYTPTETKTNPGWERLEGWVRKWLDTYQIGNDDFAIYVPDNLFNEDQENSHFFQYLCSLYGSQFHVLETKGGLKLNNLHQHNNVIYFDFGIMTGETIATLSEIAQAKEVKNLFICILLKQTQAKLVRFFEHVYYLTSDSHSELPTASCIENSLEMIERIPRSDAMLFPEFEDSQQPPQPIPPMRLAIRYLFDFSLSYYTSELCPICEHQKALEKYKSGISYLGQFSEDRQQRLKLLSVPEISHRQPCDFYWARGSEGHEMSSTLVWKMFEFKVMLENAENSTHARIRLFNYLHGLCEARSVQYRDPDSDLYAVLFFLSHEVFWFQREPLPHKKFRILLTEISEIVSICKLPKLVEHFNATQLEQARVDRSKPKMPTEEISQKQATRCKYAAISVLRSANKMRFCLAVQDMLNSAIRVPITSGSEGGAHDVEAQPAFSDNLVQNIFYHIASLCQNKYNRSMKYFRVLEKELPDEEIRGIGACSFSFDQQVTGAGIRSHIQMAMNRIENAGRSVSNFKDIKRLKSIFDKCAEQNHPDPCADIYSFSHSPNIVAWRSILQFIENILWYVKRNTLVFIPTNLTSIAPETFWSEAEDLLRKTNEMALRQIANIQEPSPEDPIIYNLGKLADYFINIDGKYSSTEDSIAKQWVDNMIADFETAIHVVFPESLFPRRRCDGIDGIKVFFPNNCLLRNLMHIREHIDKQLAQTGARSSDLDIVVSATPTERGFVEVTFKYSSAPKDCPSGNGHRGGLSTWREDIIHFGGSLDFARPTPKEQFFTINMRFQRYE